MAQVKLIVDGMTCGHCQAAVEKAVGELAGVTSVQVDLATKEVAVTYHEDQVTVAALKDVIEDIGYDVVGS